MLKEQHAERCHGEGLHQPVDHHCDDQPLRAPVDVAQACEVDRDHHRVDHRPDEDGHGQVYRSVLPARDEPEEAGEEIAQKNSRDDAEGDPQREKAIKY